MGSEVGVVWGALERAPQVLGEDVGQTACVQRSLVVGA